MILLRPDYLVFELPSGDSVPCSAAEVAAELVIEAQDPLDPQVVKNAAAAVVHYFRVELGRDVVRIDEFTLALKRVLKGFGFEVTETNATAEPVTPAALSAFAATQITGDENCLEADLSRIEKASGHAGELSFYPILREDLRLRLRSAPKAVLYSGLRDCVKGLTASKRWNGRCQQVSDDIVHFLRACLERQPEHARCLLRIH